MPELVTTTRSETIERYLTEEDWQPSSSWDEGHTVGEVSLHKLVRSSPSGGLGNLTVSVDPAWPPCGAPAWLEATLRTLEEILRLPRDWSSYRASPVRPELATALLRLLVEIMDDDTPPPAVVPTASGGLQAEWHRKGYDLEIEVCSPSRFVAHFEHVESGDAETRSVISDLRPLVDWIASISD